MLLKSMTLENFRQFRDASINFAQGEDGKNVTIIIGENGTGKTTFAQAFFWCLYGETGFSDKIMLNKLVAEDMTPEEDKQVKVVLNLHHGDVDYTLTRKQNYHKDYSNNVKGDNTIFDIGRKGRDGNTSFVKKSLCEAEVKSILPKELSKYFFFDGERIEKMSKDISTGKKATDFAEAVKGLLGLNAIISALNHLNPRGSNSVIGSYEKDFNKTSNRKIEEYTAVIERCKAREEEIEKKLEDLSSEKAAAQARMADKTAEIKQYEEGERLQEDKEKLNKRIDQAIVMRASAYKSVCKDFNDSMSSFVSLSLMKKALELLSERDFAGKDIPFMHQKTIEYLLKQKVCICGTHLDEGSVPYENVKKLIDYLPPQSISTTISDFKKEACRRSRGHLDLLSQISTSMENASVQTDEIKECTESLNEIEAELSGVDVREKVRSINDQIKFCNGLINNCDEESVKLYQELGAVRNEHERADTERRNYTLLDDQNKRTQLCLNYARQIYSELNDVYRTSEVEIRNRLQDTINEIFGQIFKGDLYLAIDEKYHISVKVNNHAGGVETSTAQNIAVIFAFITGIIKMARENRNASDEDAHLLSSESYPLVMDAPLSSFDTRRIKTVCEALPRIAEQVIIFIKDTDGDLAERNMGDKIGRRYEFAKRNEFETELI